MNENEFWIKFWKIIATSVILITISVSGCNAVDKATLNAAGGRTDVEVAKAVSDAIIQGIDPMVAKCALTHNVTSNCLIFSLKKKQQ